MFMDIDFDEQPSGLAATARAGAKFKPKARPRLRKHVSLSTTQALSNDANGKLSTQAWVAHAEAEDLSRQHTEKFQPKRTFHGNVIEGQNLGVNEEASEPHDIGYISTESSGPSIMNEEPRTDTFNMNANFSTNLQEENFPQVPQETVPEISTGNSSRGWEHEERVNSPSNNTVVGEDSYFEYTVEEQSGRGINVRRSKRATTEKQSSEEPNQCSKKPQKKKKFKHSTPRQKRTLEKELLDIPDDEIRFLPIRDLIRLVDYKEWLDKKEAKGGDRSQTQERTSKASGNQYFQDDTENFDSDEKRENQESSRVKPDSPVNYQTYLHKTARSGWSTEDTELFYEGIREFGSTLSMVQQLFPNRSRHQLKLKYKLEERKHLLKLNDALTSRPKRYTHYQNVIKKLQQEAAARKAEEKEDETEAAAAGEGIAEVEAETNDVAENAKYEESDNEEAENGPRSDGAQADKDQRSDAGDDYDDDEAECDHWASYKSDI